MISESNAVVIGAGAFGLSTAFHLSKVGLTHVAVVDKFEPGSQTSPRAAGLFKLIQADTARTQLMRLCVHKALHFEEETSVPLRVVQSGSIMLARTREHAGLIEEKVKQSRAWGIDVEMVGAQEAHRMMPFLEADGVQVACYTPGDIYIEEPSSLLRAYLQAAESLGVQVLANTPVTGIRLHESEVVGVITPRGEIKTPIVVDAAGAWARLVGDMAGAQIPVAPVRHQLYITQPIVGVQPEQPILRIIDAAVYIRPARGGLMLGGFEPDPLPFTTEVLQRSDFSINDVPLDIGVLNSMTGAVRNQVPALQGAQIQDHRGGLFTMAPDGRFIVGPVPGAYGLWTATGCNGSGFSASPGIGQVLAEWIIHGEPSIDLSLFRPERFTSLALDVGQVQERGIWQYVHYYDPIASRPA